MDCELDVEEDRLAKRLECEVRTWVNRKSCCQTVYDGLSCQAIKAQDEKGNIMELSIAPEIQNAVHEAVRVGGYSSAQEYINEALENYYRLKLERLNFEVGIGLEQAKRGELIDAEEIRFDDLLNVAIRRNAC